MATFDRTAKRDPNGFLGGPDPEADEHYATKAYVDAVATGGGGYDLSYEHVQSTASTEWVIPIPAGFTRRPAVTLWVGEQMALADISIEDGNVVVLLPYPVAGVAVLT